LYTPHKNKVFDAVQKNRREKYCEGGLTIPRTSVRTMVSHLRRGRLVWYAPDRDLGPKVSIFVPFFGVPAATVTATGTFARMGQARVIPFTQVRLDNAQGYELIIHPPFEDYPTGDDYQDALRVHEFMEREIRKCPEQYFWAQPRFKTRPPGEPPVSSSR
jgi:KDO2-lipid IV(A) lauroyltransferase